MKIEIFVKFFVLFFCFPWLSFGQGADNIVTIEIGQTVFPIERPFTISVQIPNSDARPSITFPDIPGFTKRGTSASLTNAEVAGKTIATQVITQTYQAIQPGTFRLAPFTLMINGFAARSEGATLTVRPSTPATTDPSAPAPIQMPTEFGTAFLSLNTSKASVFVGEGFTVRLSLFVADSYPFELEFWELDKQYQTLQKQIHHPNTWEENYNIKDIQQLPVVINGRKFTEYPIYQATFFPLSVQAIQLPSVTLQMIRRKPLATASPNAPSSSTTASEKTVVDPSELFPFMTRPVTIVVKPLPPHPMHGQIAVGKFRLIEGIERASVAIGKSVRYSFRIEGEGNIASLQAPLVQDVVTSDSIPNILPAGTNQVINRLGAIVTGSKTFAYFLVPRRHEAFPLGKVFYWIYFDPGLAQYDTLRSAITLRTDGTPANSVLNGEQSTVPADNAATASIYANLAQLDSTRLFIDASSLIRAIANVLLVVMIIGMIFVLFRK